MKRLPKGLKPGAHEARSRGDFPLREIPPIDPHDFKHEHVHDATPPLFKMVICCQH